MADNQVRERDQDVVTYTAFTGVRNDIAPERFSPSDLVSGSNVDLDRSGRIARRSGYTRQLAGSAHSLWADPKGETCLFVASGSLKRLNSNYTATSLKALSDAVSRMSFAKVNDQVYFANGTDSGVLENGAVRSWGLPVPGQPGLAATVGTLFGGTYQVAVTQLRADGQESGAGRAVTIDVATGGGIIVTLPALDAAAVGQVVYVSAANEGVLYQVAVVAAGTASVTITEVSGVLPLMTQFLSPPPRGQLVAFYRGRMYVAQDDVLYASTPLGFELFDLREYVQADGRITMLAPMTDKESGDTSQNSGFFIGTDRSCGVLVGSGPADTQYVPKTAYGAIEGAVAFVDGSLFGDGSIGGRELPMWLTTEGVCVGLPGLTVRNLTRTKYRFSASGQGAATFIPGPNRFVATSNL